MYWLEDHLEEGSFKTCYSDTDSMAIALTKSGPHGGDDEQQLRALFDPLVKPTKRDSWERSWKDWFVTTNQTWDIRKPGKLKGISYCILCAINVCTHVYHTHTCVRCITIYLVEFSFRKGRFLALSPKCYWSYNDENKETKTGMKGVSTVGARDIGLESFINCLYHDQDVKVISRELRKNKHQQMIYYETTKNALNPVFKKFRVQTDKISCLPLCKDGKFL